MNELITVVVPVYNVENFIEKCLLSIKNQTYKNLEILVVNDGSTDSFFEKVSYIFDSDSRFKLINKPNGGLSSARNCGIKAARGKYIAFIDSDDYVESNFVEMMYNSIIKHSADLCICGYKSIDLQSGDVINYGVCDNSANEVLNKFQLWDNFYFKNTKKSYSITIASSKLYKTDIVKKIMFEEGKLFEDEYFCYKIIHLSEKICCVPDSLYCYNINRPTSITSSNRRDDKKRYVPILLRNIFFIKNHYQKELYFKYLDSFCNEFYFKFDRKAKEFNKLFRKYMFCLLRPSAISKTSLKYFLKYCLRFAFVKRG